MPELKQKFFSSAVVACNTDAVTEEREWLASSHSCGDLGSLIESLKSGAEKVDVEISDAWAVFVVATYVVATAEFKFPRRVPREFEMEDAATDVVVGAGGGGVDGRSWTSRQVALTRRCVSSRLKRRLHLGQRPRDGGIRADGKR